MANQPIPPKPAYSQVSIRMGGLSVELGTETAYPDMVSDITHRALEVFKEAVATAIANEIDITDMRLITTDYGDGLEDDDE